MRKTAYSKTEHLGKELLEWCIKHQRKFPWRETRNPYYILASEILLHRTKAEQVKEVYQEFIKEFPTIIDLADAKPEIIKKLLNPLGLHWRTKLLLEMAKKIVDQYGTEIPSKKDVLETLPGVGQYITAAVRCFAFGYPEPLLDTNTVRILGRFFGFQVSDSSRRKKSFQELANSVLNRANPREFNYALIDLGALVCKPKKPLCAVCPLNQICLYGLKLAQRNFDDQYTKYKPKESAY